MKPCDPPGDSDDWQPDPIEMPITDEIDLHTFSPKETRDVVLEYLREALIRGFEEVRIVHGKGKGVQREIIRSTLSSHPDVTEFGDAPPHRGGHGATLARLRIPQK